MREILDFFVRNSKWLVFVFWMTAGCFLLFTRNPYQQSVYLTSAGQVAGTVYDATGQVTSYFNLRSANEELNKRNAVLQGEVIALREQLQKMQEVSGTYPDSGAVFPPSPTSTSSPPALSTTPLRVRSTTSPSTRARATASSPRWA